MPARQGLGVCFPLTTTHFFLFLLVLTGSNKVRQMRQVFRAAAPLHSLHRRIPEGWGGNAGCTGGLWPNGCKCTMVVSQALSPPSPCAGRAVASRAGRTKQAGRGKALARVESRWAEIVSFSLQARVLRMLQWWLQWRRGSLYLRGRALCRCAVRRAPQAPGPLGTHQHRPGSLGWLLYKCGSAALSHSQNISDSLVALRTGVEWRRGDAVAKLCGGGDVRGAFVVVDPFGLCWTLSHSDRYHPPPPLLRFLPCPPRGVGGHGQLEV